MDDRELTDALAGLGLDRSNHRAVALLPLVEVAWADGRVQRAERHLITDTARRYGLEPGDAWLARWLKRRPSATTFLAARTVLLALMARAGRSDVKAPDTLDALLELCVGVAEAAGGLFGLAFTYEQSERECIDEIARSLALGPALPDAVLRAWDAAAAPSAGAPPGPGIGDQVTLVRHIPQRKARRAAPTAPPPLGASDPPAPEPEPATARMTRPHRRKPRAETPSNPDADAFDEEEPTVPYFDDLKGFTGAYVVADEDEDD